MYEMEICSRAFPVAGPSIWKQSAGHCDFSSYSVYNPTATENLSVLSLLA